MPYGQGAVRIGEVLQVIGNEPMARHPAHGLQHRRRERRHARVAAGETDQGLDIVQHHLAFGIAIGIIPHRPELLALHLAKGYRPYLSLLH